MKKVITEKEHDVTSLQKELSRMKDEYCKNLQHLQNKMDDACKQYDKKLKSYDKLKVEYDGKCSIIQSSELAQSTLQNLLYDKDDMIESQKTIIEGFQGETKTDIDALTSKLENAKYTISERNIEIEEFKREVEQLKNRNDIYSNCDVEKLKQSYAEEVRKNEILNRKLEDKEIIINKMELAYTTQDEPVKTKTELIAYLKTIMAKNVRTNI